MLINDCRRFLETHQFGHLDTEEDAQKGRQIYWARDGLVVSLHESLRYPDLHGKVNGCDLSAVLVGKYCDLVNFQRGCFLSSSTPRLDVGKPETAIVIWEMSSKLHPTRGMKAFEAATLGALNYARKNRTIRIWSHIQDSYRNLNV